MVTEAQRNRIVSLLERVYEVCLERLHQTTPGSPERSDEVAAQAIATLCYGMQCAADMTPELAAFVGDQAAGLAERLRRRVEDHMVLPENVACASGRPRASA